MSVFDGLELRLRLIQVLGFILQLRSQVFFNLQGVVDLILQLVELGLLL